MNTDLYRKLMTWRNDQAKREGVETYRVFPNATLEAIATALPKNKEEMLCIKGLKDAKFGRYGMMLLKIITENSEQLTVTAGEEISSIQSPSSNIEDPVSDILSVSQFLDALNLGLSGMAARLKGEVSSVDIRERVVYFSLKDSQDESLINCLIFRSQYQISGVNIAIGDEIIVDGVPEMYKPNGRLSLKVHVIEPFGEGALKKAYDELFKKLESEGLMIPERKRILPEFPKNIALITSEQGAAIGDFTMNLGMQGFKVDFYRASVEGKKAVFEIIKAVQYFNRHAEKYDVLVIVRGGGSFESLQAFNNETLVREIAQSRIPTLLGVGHEKDVTLAALVADVMVSTPTATAKHLRFHFDEARQMVRHFEQQLPILFREQLMAVRSELSLDGEVMLAHLRSFRDIVATLRQGITERLVMMQGVVKQRLELLHQGEKSLELGFTGLFQRVTKRLDHAAERLIQYDPKRVLRLGYSLVQKGGVIMKNVSQVAIGDILDIQVSDGKLQAKVEKIL